MTKTFWTPGVAKVRCALIGQLASNGRDSDCLLVTWEEEGGLSAGYWLFADSVGGARFEPESRRTDKCRVSFGDS